MNTVKALHYLPGVQVVVFSKDEIVKQQVDALGLGVEVVSDFRTNPHGSPILTSMWKHVEHHSTSKMVGYVPGLPAPRCAAQGPCVAGRPVHVAVAPGCAGTRTATSCSATSS